jgi:chromosome segregation ATPase
MIRKTPSRSSLIKTTTKSIRKDSIITATTSTDDSYSISTPSTPRIEEAGYADFRSNIKELLEVKAQLVERNAYILSLETQLSASNHSSASVLMIEEQEKHVQKVSECIHELKSHLDESHDRNEELEAQLIEMDRIISMLKQDLLDSQDGHEVFGGVLTERDQVIRDLSRDLYESQSQNITLKRELEDCRFKHDELERELFRAKDEAIILSSRVAQTASEEVTAEYDLLRSILDGIDFQTHKDIVVSSASLNSIEASEIVPSAPPSSESIEPNESIREIASQLEKEQSKKTELIERLTLFEQELQQSTLVIISREKEISTLIAAQQAFLEEQTHLRRELNESRHQKIDLQNLMAQHDEKNRSLKVEMTELRNRLHEAQLEQMKAMMPVSLHRRQTSEDYVDAYVDSYDYSHMNISDFSDVVIQKLILVP